MRAALIMGLLCLALVGWAQEVPSPVFSASRCVRPPAVDGTVQNGEYAQALGVMGLLSFGERRLATPPVQFFLTYDQATLYLAWRCPQTSGKPRITVAERDGGVYEDDAVEFFFAVGPKLYQFVVNAGGAVYDQLDGDASYNGNITVKTSVTEKEWTGEAAIPFKELGLTGTPSDGTQWGFNFCRDQKTPVQSLSCVAPVEGQYADTGRFARLIFSGSLPTARVIDLGRLVDGENKALVEVGPSPDAERVVMLVLTLTGDGKPKVTVEKIALPPGPSLQVELDYKIASAGQKTLELKVLDLDGRTELLRQTLPFPGRILP